LSQVKLTLAVFKAICEKCKEQKERCSECVIPKVKLDLQNALESVKTENSI